MNIFRAILNKIFPPHHPALANEVPNSPQVQAAPPVDVASILNKLGQESSEKLNWQASIVDMMKLLKLDSSLSARKDLAKELGYSGDTNESASMNVWLHKQVMNKLAENGGKVPDSLRH